MCGLVGIAGDTSLKYKDVFADLLYIDTLRGNHSTGAAIVKRDDSEIMLEKAAIPGPEFVGTKEFKKLMDTFGVKAMIGHNRYATIGEKTADNAHPFQFPNVVGAHNGTIDRLALCELDDYRTFGTDSEAVYNSINLYGLKETIGKLTGAWALTYFDKEFNTMNLLRNNKRPLYFTYSDDMETLLWASEAEMLAWIVGRHNIRLRDNRIFECEPDIHYRWVLPEKYGDKLDKPTVAKIEGYKYTYKAPTYVHYAGSNAWQQQSYQEQKIKEEQQKLALTGPPTKQAIKTRPVVNTKKFRPPYKDAYGKILNKKQFESLVECGCMYCDVDGQKWGDFIYPLKDDIDNRKMFLCEECYNDDDIRELVEMAI